MLTLVGIENQNSSKFSLHRPEGRCDVQFSVDDLEIEWESLLGEPTQLSSLFHSLEQLNVTAQPDGYEGNYSLTVSNGVSSPVVIIKDTLQRPNGLNEVMASVAQLQQSMGNQL